MGEETGGSRGPQLRTGSAASGREHPRSAQAPRVRGGAMVGVGASRQHPERQSSVKHLSAFAFQGGSGLRSSWKCLCWHPRPPLLEATVTEPCTKSRPNPRSPRGSSRVSLRHDRTKGLDQVSIHGSCQPDVLEASEIRKGRSRAQIHPLDDNLPSADTPEAGASKSGRVGRRGGARKWAGGVFPGDERL